MRSMTIDQFHELLVTYISQVSKEADLSDPDTIVFSEEFDDLLRHIQSKPNAKLKLTYIRETAEIKLLYRQLQNLLETRDTIRIIG